MTQRSDKDARENGLSMGRTYVDRIVAQYPGAVRTMRDKLKTVTLDQVRKAVLADTLNNPLLRKHFRESELHALAEGFLQSALARVDELVALEGKKAGH